VIFRLIIFFLCISVSSVSQSFNPEKTAAINYLKRMYNASPFEGAKKIEGDEAKYYAVAVTFTKASKNIDTAIL
jgi:hypothetical protein